MHNPTNVSYAETFPPNWYGLVCREDSVDIFPDRNLDGIRRRVAFAFVCWFLYVVVDVVVVVVVTKTSVALPPHTKLTLLLCVHFAPTLCIDHVVRIHVVCACREQRTAAHAFENAARKNWIFSGYN